MARPLPRLQGGSVTVSVLGIRHHGPGSARAVREELRRLEPDAVLVEGPPEADALLGLAPEMEPPVALLAHARARAVFWPFAVFSPEWQAILYGAAARIPVRFIDLPAAATLAAPDTDAHAGPHSDPLGELAAAAGYDDPERWWEDVVEHRGDTPFQVIAEAMAAVREGYAPADREARREAHMRRCLRAAIKEGFRRIAVVCGAWHVPALTGPLPPATADNALLRGLPKVKTELTWVPWTYGRLASWSGYGAGITSPGWYHHLFTAPDRPVERWLTAAAAVLREEGLAVSSAHVIEAIRLAEGLAALRGRPLAGLGEVTDAVRAVLCDGDELLVSLVQRRMVVGDRLGAVSERTPMVPLQRDLAEQRRKVKLKAEAVDRELDLDLRRPLDLARSHLLHRLRMLGVEWGRLGETRGKGTFREVWRLAWHPEFDLTLIESAALGTTVESAATRRARDLASDAGAGAPGRVRPAPAGTRGVMPSPGPPSPGAPSPGAAVPAGAAVSLAGLTGLVELCLLADLRDALPDVLAALSAKAALDTDLTHLMAALPAMARAHRYGDVRGTSAAGLEAVAESMLDRICAGLPAAVAGLDDESAAALVVHVDAVHAAAALLADSAVASTPRGPAEPVPAPAPRTIGEGPAATSPMADSPSAEPGATPAGSPSAEPGPTPAGSPSAGSEVPAGPGASVSGEDCGATPSGGGSSAGAGSEVPAGPGASVSGEDCGATPSGGGASAGAGSTAPVGSGTSTHDEVSRGKASPRERWLATLGAVCDHAEPHGLIEGRLTRLLLDAGKLDARDASDRMSRAMSHGHPPARSAAWVEGFLAGGALMLVHDPRLLALVDGWLSGLTGDQFTEVLPLLRRTFAAFEAPERRAIGQRVRAAGSGTASRPHEVDDDRAAEAVRTVQTILGVAHG
ncbi:DUF5682 family protein [Nonomuraea mangrovi]|uniref:DUF5682 family protein n=1 Tax=Nonomuraea TaxID=83681 RepID=UPI003A8F6D3E